MLLPDISGNPHAEKLLLLIRSNLKEEAVAFIKSGTIRNIDAQAVLFSFTDNEIDNKASSNCEELLRQSVSKMPSVPSPRDAIIDNAIAGNINGIHTILQQDTFPSVQLWKAFEASVVYNNFDIAIAILNSQKKKSLATASKMAKQVLTNDNIATDAIPMLVDYIILYKERIAKSLGHCLANIVISNNRAKFDALLSEINTRQLDADVNEAIEIAMEDGKPEYVDTLLPFLNSVPDFDAMDIEQIYPKSAQKEFNDLNQDSLPVKVSLLVRWHIAMSGVNILALMEGSPSWLHQYYLNELNRKISD